MEEAAKLLKFEMPALIMIQNSFAENEIGSHIFALKMEAPGSKIIMVSFIRHGGILVARPDRGGSLAGAFFLHIKTKRSSNG